MDESKFQVALDAALRFLGPRPRSAWEVRHRLRRRGLEPTDIEEVVARLQEWGYLDDAAFADFWIENRESFRPRGKRLLEQELRQRGVDIRPLEDRLAALDEEDGAMRAAQKKAQGLARCDYPAFVRKLGDFLRRRGFSYEVASTVTQRLWLEVSSGPAQGDG